MTYYVRNGKWRGERSQYTSYGTLQEARIAAANLLNHEYYDYDSVPIYIKKNNRYSIYSFVREIIGDYEGEDENVPVKSMKFVYRTPSGIECLMDGKGNLGKTKWRAWFNPEYAKY